MLHRPLVFVSGLTLGDYLLWNWSLNGNHDVLALISGLTLPPLALACLWLLVLSAARVIARVTRRTVVPAGETPRRQAKGAPQPSAGGAPFEEPAPARAAGGSSGKLAA